MGAVCLEHIEALRAEFGKAYNRCQAARKNPAGVLNAVQCSGSCRKHFSYCWRHSIQDEAYRNCKHRVPVVKFEAASTSESPDVAKLAYFTGATFMSAVDDNDGKQYVCT